MIDRRVLGALIVLDVVSLAYTLSLTACLWSVSAIPGICSPLEESADPFRTLAAITFKFATVCYIMTLLALFYTAIKLQSARQLDAEYKATLLPHVRVIKARTKDIGALQLARDIYASDICSSKTPELVAMDAIDSFWIRALRQRLPAAYFRDCTWAPRVVFCLHTVELLNIAVDMKLDGEYRREPHYAQLEDLAREWTSVKDKIASVIQK